MELRNLTKEESEIVKDCLQCVADGHVILHDAEFQTVMGIDVDELLEVLRAWPAIDESDESVYLAINNSMNNLLGYPHGKHEAWNEIMDTPLSDIGRIYKKWLGSNSGGIA